ncbi:uncharacterized protein LOC131953318 [Physella acuta]|uniref:uncharacterized protein LOC131953318 n=1 Tax=Physella acuta TaxID=109671 RepID=UPI0027DE44CC|nr:uncharacterized protein LOC131953318 [Physella acuta]
MAERCLCVALPLKVKLIVSKEKTIVCLAVMFIVILATVIPTYATSSIQWRFYPEYNATLLGLAYADNYFDATAIPNIINNPILSVASFTIVLLCTSIIITNLNKKSKWRQSTSAKQPGSQPNNLTSKDKRATKMVTIISVMLLASVTPSVLTDFIASVDAEFCLTGKHRNMFYLFYCVTFTFETVNSSLSIAVYYNMNSRFRQTCRRVLHAGCRVKPAGSNVEVQGHSQSHQVTSVK